MYILLCCVTYFALSIERTWPDLHFTTDYILYNWVCDEEKTLNLEHILKIKKYNKNVKCIQQNFKTEHLNEKINKIKLRTIQKILKNKRYRV